ncbi:hypothetical protein [Haloarcula sp. JP-L23]|uniref:DUF7836 family putative zinc-binding protein n=1 Tax=Haloarcula sp. JP-L23 TaxID=2716717 RepID=UPI00140EF8BB|nr:hypothetical protein G9465_11465 [Haloarcula sp. JP-L23]
MQEAWVQLQCPDCEENWEANVTDLSSPDTTFACKDCGHERRLAEFMKTARDLEVLEQFE